jgi:chemotaxis protein MotA
MQQRPPSLRSGAAGAGTGGAAEVHAERRASLKFWRTYADIRNRMIPLAGILIVLGAVAAGFLMESGSVGALLQPAELIIIAGSALGAMIAANPIDRLARTGRTIRRVFRGPTMTRERYLGTLVMLHSVFRFARHHGPGALEEAVDDPAFSLMFAGHGEVTADPEVLEFICDTLRISVLGSVPAYSLDTMLADDLELRHKEALGPVQSLEMLSDSLPGFGIVAAVLGVILAMGSIREPPMLMGVRIASALIGTFTGILLAYGVVSPVSARLEKMENAEAQYFETLRAGLIAFAKGMPTPIAVECARRAVPPHLRPDFEKTERACRGLDIHMPRKSSVLK